MVSQLLAELTQSREVLSRLNKRSELRALPRGDGHRVLVAPGLLANDRATRALRRFLSSKGYDAQEWGLGRNLGSMTQFDAFIDVVRARAEASGAPVSLLGWSLGGIAARWAAHNEPRSVRQVITLGSPFRQDPRSMSIFPLYQAVSGVRRSDFTDEKLAAISNTPVVPATSIVSLDDRIAPPATGLQPMGPTSETVEVRGSHTGLVNNPDVWSIVADRLAQPAGHWSHHVAA